MAFPPGFLDELRARLSLSDVVGRKVSLKRKSGSEFSGLCPFHNEKTPSFTVNDKKGFFYCFGCHEKGSAIDFVIKTEGLSFPEAVEKLAREKLQMRPASPAITAYVNYSAPAKASGASAPAVDASAPAAAMKGGNP